VHCETTEPGTRYRGTTGQIRVYCPRVVGLQPSGSRSAPVAPPFIGGRFSLALAPSRPRPAHCLGGGHLRCGGVYCRPPHHRFARGPFPLWGSRSVKPPHHLGYCSLRTPLPEYASPPQRVRLRPRSPVKQKGTDNEETNTTELETITRTYGERLTTQKSPIHIYSVGILPDFDGLG